MTANYFENFKTGDTYNFAIPAMSKAEIMAFAAIWTRSRSTSTRKSPRT